MLSALQRAEIPADALEAFNRARDKISELSLNEKEHAAEQRLAQKALDEALAGLGVAVPDALSAPGNGEALMVYHPLPRGYLGLALTQDRIVAFRLSAVDVKKDSPEQISKTLLEPFRKEISAAKRLRFAPHGAIAGLDFHALPWGEAPLVVTLPVSYAVDLEQPTAQDRKEKGIALVIGDTAGDLKEAREEMVDVRDALKDRGYESSDMTTVSTTSLRAKLSNPNVWLFHFAGHNHFQARDYEEALDGGVDGGQPSLDAAVQGSDVGAPPFSAVNGILDGWESGIRMTNLALFSVGDVATLSRSPEIVVLSGCETGRSLDIAGGAGVGVAQAFVAKGARAVVASTININDVEAKELMNFFYDAPTFPADIPEALRHAQRYATKAGAGRFSFRVFLP